MTADRLETFIGQLKDADSYQNDLLVRAAVDEGIEKLRALMGEERKEEAIQFLGELTTRVQQISNTPDTASELDPDARPSAAAASAYLEAGYGPGHFFGPAELRQAFGDSALKFDGIPLLPTWLEIELHAKLGHVLRLRMPEDRDECKYTVDSMSEYMDQFLPFEVRGMDKIESSGGTNPTYGWAFTSKGVLPSTKGEIYPVQGTKLFQYAENGLYAERPMPQVEWAAYDRLKKSLTVNASGLTVPANVVKEQVEAAMNVSYRPSLADVMFDFLVEYGNIPSLPNERWNGVSMTATKGAQMKLLGFSYSEGVVEFSTASWIDEDPSAGSHFSLPSSVSAS